MNITKISLLFMCGVVFCAPALSASSVIILNGGDWWKRIGPSVCRINNQTCYSRMASNAYCSSIGNLECWDDDANCWGKKYICENALKSGATNNLLTKTQIASTTLINSDFDINIESESERCFGVRRTYDNGASAAVNGKKVKVWCNNVPLASDNIEIIKTGQVILDGTQPTCTSLSENGFAAVQNGSCWGKEYRKNFKNYYIDCKSGQLEPYRIIDINSASDYDTNANVEPDTYEKIKNKFQNMLKTSRAQHDKYFK